MKLAIFIAILLLYQVCSFAQADEDNIRLAKPHIDQYGKINKKELLKMKALEVNREDGKIISFTLICTDDRLRSVSFVSDSNRLTEPMLREIVKSSPGERLIFADIVIASGETTLEMHPITFCLKE
jgi:hypothetical protein